MYKKPFFVFAALLILLGTLTAKEKLVLLCGTTMRYAVQEIVENFEEINDVEFEISYGGSGSLMKLIESNGIGDIFLPGSDSYIEQMDGRSEILDSVFIGYNQAALIVAKGNPQGISRLADLADPSYGVVLASADSGSIGKEAFKILGTAGLEDQVMENVLYLTTDSKDLDGALRDGIADVTINWKATSTWDGNCDCMEVVNLPEASQKRLVFGMLKYSQNKPMAEKFLDYARTDEAKSIFEKHGF